MFTRPRHVPHRHAHPLTHPPTHPPNHPPTLPPIQPQEPTTNQLPTNPPNRWNHPLSSPKISAPSLASSPSHHLRRHVYHQVCYFIVRFDKNKNAHSATGTFRPPHAAAFRRFRGQYSNRERLTLPKKIKLKRTLPMNDGWTDGSRSVCTTIPGAMLPLASPRRVN